MEGGRARIENDASVKGVSAFDAERGERGLGPISQFVDYKDV